MRKYIFLGLLVLAAVALAGWWFVIRKPSQPTKLTDTHATTQQHTTVGQVSDSTGFNKQLNSTTDPTSIWVVVNKQHPLQPVTFVPPDLVKPDVPAQASGAAQNQMRQEAANALKLMVAGAAQTGIHIELQSGYRSYTYQVSLYSGYVGSVGQSAADQESARPGYSEHQTGLAVDIRAMNGVCSLDACFGTTPEGEWLAANAYQYGFILRYPSDKVAITGYEYEPWHFRYVGKALSTEMHNEHIETLEEFFGITGGTTYAS